MHVRIICAANYNKEKNKTSTFHSTITLMNMIPVTSTNPSRNEFLYILARFLYNRNKIIKKKISDIHFPRSSIQGINFNLVHSRRFRGAQTFFRSGFFKRFITRKIRAKKNLANMLERLLIFPTLSRTQQSPRMRKRERKSKNYSRIFAFFPHLHHCCSRFMEALHTSHHSYHREIKKIIEIIHCRAPRQNRNSGRSRTSVQSSHVTREIQNEHVFLFERTPPDFTP